MPRALVAGATLWAGASYFVTGPSIAARVALFDHMPACERSHDEMTIADAERRQREVAARSSDPAKELASELLREFGDTAFMRQFDLFGGGMMGRTIDRTLEQIERGKEAASDAAKELERRTASNLASSGSVCGCVADTAISETRTEWAIHVGTLALVRPAPVINFGQRMTQIQASGRCTAMSEAGR
jgi:hypothetical protein